MPKIALTTLALACAVLTGCASTGSQPQASSSPPVQTTCKAITEPEVAALFERWNQSLKSLSATEVVKNYAARSILLPTVSNKARLSAAEKEDYFVHFLENKPQGRIDMRFVDIGCNTVLDAAPEGAAAAGAVAAGARAAGAALDAGAEVWADAVTVAGVRRSEGGSNSMV